MPSPAAPTFSISLGTAAIHIKPRPLTRLMTRVSFLGRCHICREYGHMRRNCPLQICAVCGMYGHAHCIRAQPHH